MSNWQRVRALCAFIHLHTLTRPPCPALSRPGYDVWFGNVRGNVFSRNHTVLDISNADFWSFSW